MKNTIFLIDDSSAEPILLENAIMQSEKLIRLESMDDSKAAVDEMKRRSIENIEQLPNLILLDLNMPGYSGIDVLNIFKMDKILRLIPVVIMTSSNLDNDFKRCLEAGANSVLVKPSGNEKYVEVVKTLHDYWFETVKTMDSGQF